MDRIIKLSELKAAVEQAYNTVKAMPAEGAVDKCLSGVDTSKFGISVVLADGTEISYGDVDTDSLLGAIGRVPVSAALFQQPNLPCSFFAKTGSKPKGLGVSAYGIRAVSALEPVGDADGKWDIVSNTIYALSGSAFKLDDSFYKFEKQRIEQLGVENKLAEAGFVLYDDAPVALDLYAKLVSMRATVRQLAAMGATVAADGLNPANGQRAYDGTISQKVVALMAVKGPHKMSKPWLIKTGLPARTSFGGAMMGVLPGVFGIAAYSPLLNESGISIKSAKAIAMVMETLGLSALGSARVRIEA